VPTNLEKLRGLLQELFQLDQADLDFGIYRIMNQKRDEVVRFLDKDLLPQVQEAFKAYKPADRAALQKELDEKIAFYKADGVDPETVQKVKDLRKTLVESAVDVTALENEVFSHLFNFFRRYYQEGDFISLRRYKEGVYAIPYEGEEVKLHWANADQYFIKSSETFRDYTFTMPSGKRVRVHLVAAFTEQNDNKATAGAERRFCLCDENALYEANGELYIRFEYRPVTLDDWTEDRRTLEAKKEKPKLPDQSDLLRQAINTVLQLPGFEAWAKELGKAAPTDKNPNRTVLEKHLTQYTARNTFDYFIHKDLGGFLRRELGFYIKNEVMHLDDVAHKDAKIDIGSANRFIEHLSKIQVIRSIADKIIKFLEQLENFQKRLWLKKKFVIESHYCATLDRVPLSLYPEIAANKAQRDEWVKLFAIDEIEADLHSPSYSEPLTVGFLESNAHLVVDTRFFSAAFKDQLLASIGDLASDTCGTLIDSDNYHALQMAQATYAGRVPFLYIDPPYNTGTDEFCYKDNYQHSSWLSLIYTRLVLAKQLMSPHSVLTCSLDDTESPILNSLITNRLGLIRLGEFVWRTRNTDNRVLTMLSVDHEYIWVYSRPGTTIQGRVIDRSDFKNPDNDSRGPYTTDPLTGKANAIDRPNLHFNVTNPETGDEYPPDPDFGWITDRQGFKQLMDDKLVWWPKNPKTGNPRKKRFLSETSERAPVSSLGISIKQGEGNHDLSCLMGSKSLNFPKPVSVMRSTIDFCAPKDAVIVDFFAGSGTTGQAVLELNRQPDTHRKMLLVEMGRHFDAILKPRIMKVIYSDEWNEGKPVSRHGTSAVLKYLRLESYEDALNNLQLKRTHQQARLLEADDDVREQYVLSYMLDVESRGSQSLLNVDGFRNPDEYKLRVERNGETQLLNVDLVETFNWLLGLTVKHIDVIRGVRVVEGANPKGERVLVLWRNIDTMDNDALDRWFQKQNYNTKEMVYDLFYINGDNNLENLRRSDETWKVRLIEEEFQRLMFDVQDV